MPTNPSDLRQALERSVPKEVTQYIKLVTEQELAKKDQYIAAQNNKLSELQIKIAQLNEQVTLFRDRLDFYEKQSKYKITRADLMKLLNNLDKIHAPE